MSYRRMRNKIFKIGDKLQIILLLSVILISLVLAGFKCYYIQQDYGWKGLLMMMGDNKSVIIIKPIDNKGGNIK